MSWLNLADRLMELPTALLGVAMGVVLLPQLSAAQARNDAPAYSAMLDWGLRLVVLLALPCAVALIVFGQPMLAVLFHHGRFTANDVVQSAGPLMGYGAGLLGIVAVKVLAPGYYARQDVRTPVRIAVGRAADHAGAQPRAGAVAEAFGARADDRAGRAGQRDVAAARPAAPGRVPARSGLGRLRCSRWCSVACCLARRWSGRHAASTGSACKRAPWSRAGLLAAVLAGVAVLYFGVLAACGVRLREFMRRG